MTVGQHYLSAESRAVCMARAAEIRAQLAARRASRLGDERSQDRRTTDRRSGDRRVFDDARMALARREADQMADTRNRAAALAARGRFDSAWSPLS